MHLEKHIPGIFFFLLLAGPLLSQEATLAYRLQRGSSYRLEIEIQQSTSSESMESEEISMSSHMTLTFRVDSVQPDGMIHMTFGYSGLALSVLAPGLSLDINSGRGSSRLLSNLIDSIQCSDFHLVMSPSGELISLKGLNGLFRSLASYPTGDPRELDVILRTLDEAYGYNAFCSLYSLFVAFYPTVQPIKNWTRDVTYYFNTKPVQMVNRYFVTRTSGEYLIIQGLGMLGSLEGNIENTAWGQVESKVSGTQTYDYQVDGTNGWLRRCVSRQRVLIETTILHGTNLPTGLKIPSYTETVFEVRGSSTKD
jgi:hypothetical protein